MTVAMTLGDIAARFDLVLQGDEHTVIDRLASLPSASGQSLSFYAQSAYRQALIDTAASAVLLRPEDVPYAPCAALVTDQPEAVFAQLLAHFYPEPLSVPGIHPTAVIGQGCDIGADVSIGPYCVIGNEVVIESGVQLSAHTVIGDEVFIGEKTCIDAQVTVEKRCRIGQRVHLSSGVRIGAAGFGLTHLNGTWHTLPQVGRVIIGDDVDVGANTTIDRGALDDTVIEQGVKLDNQIQIAHNVRIGAHTAIAGKVGIAGSTVIGRHCMIGGAACVGGHLSIADQVVITGMSMVITSIKEPGVYSSGTVAQKNTQWRRSVVHFKGLNDIVRRIKVLERKK
jgi:UDP-3-O-[3-hydroxymyristoyl] glucosamine N-acyltransferase